jgi:hypothetical protein
LHIIKDCKWFTWSQENEICVAFSDCPYLDELKSDTISGQRDCSVYTCEQQGFCRDITVDIQVARNEDHCIKLCPKETKCNWYSFNAENNVCVHCPEIDTSCLSCYFGQIHLYSFYKKAPQNVNFISQQAHFNHTIY